ncbi:S41 family peptidase [Brevundimonas diminuta]|uniref:Uncharacterized protein n=1 Tax=Brevundimonas diminuta TaxID=293 RepID=A0A1Z3LVM1_BREDI|nr:S41 family peptidase [Brevundimonas diminuta]ASD26221.1 hypothetical protein CD943_04545 [Brevundimonas diminuta]
MNFALIAVAAVQLSGQPAPHPIQDGQVAPRLSPAAWRADIHQFRNEVVLRDQAFDAVSREQAAERLASLEARLSGLSDAEITGELARIAALADNAHTRLDPLRNRERWSRLPVRLWKFSDGWRVVATRRDQTAWLGARVLGINEIPVEEGAAKVRPLFAGNAAWADYMAGYSLVSPEALQASGVIERGPVVFAIATSAGRRDVVFSPEPLEGRSRPDENWWHLASVDPRTSGWSHRPHSRAMLVFERSELSYVFVRCRENVAYLRLNRTADQAGRTPLADWGREVLAELDRHPPAKLVIDLRFNTGGDLSKALPFIGSIAASALGQRPDGLAVLINGQTFSAGITQAAWLRLHSRARFFGEPVGDETSFWAEGDNVLLRHSGLTARYSDGGHHYSSTPIPQSMRERVVFSLPAPSLEPDHRVGWSWDEYAAGLDPVLEAASPDLQCEPVR